MPGRSGVGETRTGPQETCSVDVKAPERLSIILADLHGVQAIEFPKCPDHEAVCLLLLLV